MLRTSYRFASIGLALCLLVGCKSTDSATAKNDKPFKLPNPMDWGTNPDEPRKADPDRIVVTWTDTIKQTQGQAAERGFGGRIYFYDKGKDPVAVDGRLVVYAFDETDRSPVDHKPTKRYVFPVEQLERQMSVSEIGPSYSVWLPWGPTDAPPKDVSLVARFEPLRGGGLLVSDMTQQRLPGNGLAPVGPTMIAESTKGATITQAGFEEQSGAKPIKSDKDEEPRKRLSTTTIKLNR